MKNVVLFALLVAAVSAVSAHATNLEPSPTYVYNCDYTNPTMHEKDPGTSTFSISHTSVGLQGIEYFQALFNGGVITDNRKVTFAKPVNHIHREYPGGPIEILWTDWEFTVNPSGPQCNARVFDDGSISFTACTDGSSRNCN